LRICVGASPQERITFHRRKFTRTVLEHNVEYPPRIFPQPNKDRMSERRWRVVVFTDEDGGEFYRLNIQAEDADTAERNANDGSS
jgi:hypothetical protein